MKFESSLSRNSSLTVNALAMDAVVTDLYDCKYCWYANTLASRRKNRWWFVSQVLFKTPSATTGNAVMKSLYLHWCRALIRDPTPGRESITARTSGESISFSFNSTRFSETTPHTHAWCTKSVYVINSYVVNVERDSRKRVVAPLKSLHAAKQTPSYTFSLFLRSQSAPPGCSRKSLSFAIWVLTSCQSSWKMCSRMTLNTISIFWPIATVFVSHCSNATSADGRSPTLARKTAFSNKASRTSTSPRFCVASAIFRSRSAIFCPFLAIMDAKTDSSSIHPKRSQYPG
mmetsp:Transcript_6780/g.25612  ORF Transcript_6780/g.25612 Transcript_6780/m.25612 type:complete len:287 (-) Transcript_6780:227-1087(-)